MNPWDEEQSVRPIPIGRDGDQAPNLRNNKTPHRHRPRRPWLPLAISSLTVGVVVVSVSVFGGLQFEDPLPPDPGQFASRAGDVDTTIATATTTTILPKRLDESLPGLSDRLTLIATTVGGIRSLLWDPSSRTPLPYELKEAPWSELVNTSAAFDSGGRTLAVVVNTPSGTDIWAGTTTNIGDLPDITRAASWAWHATEVGRLAWTGVRDDGELTLNTGTISPLTGDLVDVRTRTELIAAGGIVRWDAKGFVINDARTIRALNDDGSLAWERSGVAASASSTFVIALVPDQTPTWTVLDRETGETSTEIGPLPEASRRNAWLTTSQSTGLIATVVRTDSRSSLTIRGTELSAPRIIQVDTSVLPFGFTSQGEYFIFKATDTNDLVFVNWRTGAIHSVPVPDEYVVIGLDLG